MKFILRAQDEAGAMELGGKGWSLASATRAGMPVPPWFGVSPRACTADLSLSPALKAELASALAELCPGGERVAVRSSAADEDGEELSFAGQLESHLFVAPGEAADRVASVWRSAFAPRALAYREKLRGNGSAAAPAVLVQRMVAADVAGVAFSADPVSGRRGVAVVAAAPGVGTAVVSGDADADTFHVERSGRIVHRRLAGTRACLSDAQAAEIASLARRCAGHFGAPQDIEWAMKDGRIWLLQSRAITSLHALPDPDGELAIWDCSNIAESYGGVTTPLTFSFIRRCYEHVYRELSRLGGVGGEAMRANDDAFRRMLGFVRGRVYYNLLAWYRLLAMAPGFEYNRRFLDEMLGVGVTLDASRLPRPAYTGIRAKAALLRQSWRTLVHHLTVERINARFHERLETALAGEAQLEALRADELVAHFRSLERQLLMGWDAPLINDFFAMIFHGVLKRLVALWLAARDAGLDNHLLSGEGGIISVEPVRRMQQMARVAAAEPGLGELLREGTRAQALAGVQRSPELQRLFLAYLERFSDRCPEELKLESLTLRDDPLPLLRTIGHLAAAAPRPAGDEQSLRKAAEARVAAALRGRPLRRLVFAWVLRNARARVRDRENLRFERTRVFARVRRIAVELGKRLHALRLLDSPRDVFFLELDEITGFVDGTATCADLRGLCALRGAQFERQQNLEAPPRRFETRGLGQPEFAVAQAPAAAESAQGGERRGTACCPGIVRGRARIVRRPETATLAAGEILVAERTDPGWVLLFARAAGLVVERGSLLSHAAIVAREMALPAVVGVAHACAWLRDGELIEIDGATGAVRRLHG